MKKYNIQFKAIIQGVIELPDNLETYDEIFNHIKNMENSVKFLIESIVNIPEIHADAYGDEFLIQNSETLKFVEKDETTGKL